MDDITSRYRTRSPRYTRPVRGRQAASSSGKPAPATKPRRTQPVDSDDPPWIPDEDQPISRPSRPKRRKWPILLVLLIMIAAGGTAAAFYIKNKEFSSRLDPKGQPAPADPLTGANQAQAQVTGSVRLVATGDMIAHDSINENAKVAGGKYDYLKLMEDMKPYFDKADIKFCNQSTPAGGSKFGISGYPIFNAPVEFARGIESVGCNLINIGTNHTNDKGQDLIDATVAAWDNRQGVLAVAGANRSVEEQKKLRTFEVKGMKFAFLAYTTYTNESDGLKPYGVNMYKDSTAKAEIKAAREAADFVIVSMRWGTEYSQDVNPEQEKLAKNLANYGADVVLGHGPHVLEPVQRIKAADGRETLVWFSLGNFLNSQLDIESLIGGFAVMDIDLATKKITKIGFMPVYQHYEWTAAQKQAGNLMARKNFRMVPLDKAKSLLDKSQNDTTVKEQTDRVKKVLNKFTEVPLLTSGEF